MDHPWDWVKKDWRITPICALRGGSRHNELRNNEGQDCGGGRNLASKDKMMLLVEVA